MKKLRYHKNCGGVIRNNRCTRCGKTWSKIKGFFAGDVEEREVRFNEREYKRRIREGRDLTK